MLLKNSIEKVSRDLFINWVAETWLDDKQISPYNIKNSFKVAGLTNKLDESENELFTGLKKIRRINSGWRWWIWKKWYDWKNYQNIIYFYYNNYKFIYNYLKEC